MTCVTHQVRGRARTRAWVCEIISQFITLCRLSTGQGPLAGPGPGPSPQAQGSGFPGKDLGGEGRPVGGGLRAGEGAMAKAGAAPYQMGLRGLHTTKGCAGL